MSAREISASHFANDIAELLDRLVVHEVDFLLVGGEAVIYYGYPRVTGDVDVFYRLSPENTKRLFAALREFWGGKVPGIRAASSLGQEGIIIQFGVPPHRVDFINRIDGVSYEQALQGCEDVVVAAGTHRLPIRFIGLDALILNKRAAGRPKDLDDLRYLEKARLEKQKKRKRSR